MAEYFLDKGEDVWFVYWWFDQACRSLSRIVFAFEKTTGTRSLSGRTCLSFIPVYWNALANWIKIFGGGSITALPVIETQVRRRVRLHSGPMLFPITDGQIYLVPDLFYQGNRPGQWDARYFRFPCRFESATSIKADEKSGRPRCVWKWPNIANWRLSPSSGSGIWDEDTKRNSSAANASWKSWSKVSMRRLPVEDQVARYFLPRWRQADG